MSSIEFMMEEFELLVTEDIKFENWAKNFLFLEISDCQDTDPNYTKLHFSNGKIPDNLIVSDSYTAWRDEAVVLVKYECSRIVSRADGRGEGDPYVLK